MANGMNRIMIISSAYNEPQAESCAHFSVSSTISLPKSAGDPGSGVPLTGLHLRSSRAALTSLLSLLTISAGVARRGRTKYPPRSPEPTSPLNGVVFDLRYSFFLFDQIVIAVTDSLSVPP